MMVVVDYLDELQWNWSTWLQWSVSWRDPASPDHTLAHSAESPRTTLVWWGGTEHTAPNPWICWMEPETLNNWYQMIMVSLWYLWSPLWQLMNHDWSVASLRHHRGEVVSPGVPGHLPHWLEVVDHHESTWRDEFQILKSVGNSWSVPGGPSSPLLHLTDVLTLMGAWWPVLSGSVPSNSSVLTPQSNWDVRKIFQSHLALTSLSPTPVLIRYSLVSTATATSERAELGHHDTDLTTPPMSQVLRHLPVSTSQTLKLPSSLPLTRYWPDTQHSIS